MGTQGLLRALLVLIMAGCIAGIVLSRAERAEVTIRIAFLASSDDEDYIGAVAFRETLQQLESLNSPAPAAPQGRCNAIHRPLCSAALSKYRQSPAPRPAM